MKRKWMSVAAVVAVAASPVQAQLFSSGGLDPGFCKNKAVRQTVVYVDDMLMIEGASPADRSQTEWVSKLVLKLQASLSPGERTTVVRLSPKSASSAEIWTGCWPAYTQVQKDTITKDGPYILQKNPLDNLPEQQKFFATDVVAAVSKIYFDAKRPQAEVVFSADKAPKKELLRSLASDESRFSHSSVTLRAIVYSDAAENSDLGNVFRPNADSSTNFAEKLGTHLRKSVFYVFGVGKDVSGQPIQESSKVFWTRALRSMSATIGGFGADLNVTNGIPSEARDYSMTLNEDQEELDGKASIITDADGNIVDSWIGFSRLDITGLTGTLRCANETCKLDGTTTTSLTTDSPTESVNLSGKSSRMTGSIGIKGTKTFFPLTAVLAKQQ